MGGDFISFHLFGAAPPQVRQETILRFASDGFVLTLDVPLTQEVIDNTLEEDDTVYGVAVSGRSGSGWVSVYVEDWPDSGLLARHLSHALQVPVLEVWGVEDTQWGYTYFENGIVRDRFTNDLALLDSPEEAAQHQGSAEALSAVLSTPPSAMDALLRDAHSHPRALAAPFVNTLASQLGLPFENIYQGYTDFFEDDFDEDEPSDEQWQTFRHLTFQHPARQETLSELTEV